MLVQQALSAENVPLNPAAKAVNVAAKLVEIVASVLKVPLNPALRIVHVAAKSLVIVFFKSASAEKVPFASMLIALIAENVPLKSAAKIVHVC